MFTVTDSLAFTSEVETETAPVSQHPRLGLVQRESVQPVYTASGQMQRRQLPIGPHHEPPVIPPVLLGLLSQQRRVAYYVHLVLEQAISNSMPPYTKLMV